MFNFAQMQSLRDARKQFPISTSGDYFGLTVRENIGISAQVLQLSELQGRHVTISEIMCTGSRSPIFKASIVPVSPRIVVIFMPIASSASGKTLYYMTCVVTRVVYTL